MHTDTHKNLYLKYLILFFFQETSFAPFGWTAMFVQTGLVFVLLAIAIAALCLAGIHRGEQRMLLHLNKMLTEAKVIESRSNTRSSRRNDSGQRYPDAGGQHRQAASMLNRPERVELEPVQEEVRRPCKPPTPTRTYSFRFMQPRPSLARRLSVALGAKPLIDLDIEAQAPPPLPEPLRPEEEGDWV